MERAPAIRGQDDFFFAEPEDFFGPELFFVDFLADDFLVVFFAVDFLAEPEEAFAPFEAGALAALDAGAGAFACLGSSSPAFACVDFFFQNFGTFGSLIAIPGVLGGPTWPSSI